MFRGCSMSSESSSSAGVQAKSSSSSTESCGRRCPDWLDMVTPAPPGAIASPISSSSIAVPYKSTARMASMGAWLGETPAAFTIKAMSPRPCARAMSARTESRDARSASWATALNPASLRTFPEPMRRVMAKPICPAPMSIITSAFTKSTSFPHSSDLFDLTLSFGVRSKSRSGKRFFRGRKAAAARPRARFPPRGRRARPQGRSACPPR